MQPPRDDATEDLGVLSRAEHISAMCPSTPRRAMMAVSLENAKRKSLRRSSAHTGSCRHASAIARLVADSATTSRNAKKETTRPITSVAAISYQMASCIGIIEPTPKRKRRRTHPMVRHPGFCDDAKTLGELRVDRSARRHAATTAVMPHPCALLS